MSDYATAQALVAAALADGTSRIAGLRVTEHTRAVFEALRGLGVPLRHDENLCKIEVTGCGGFWPNSEARLELGDFCDLLALLTAASSIGGGQYTVTGANLLPDAKPEYLVGPLYDLGAGITATDRDGKLTIQTRSTVLRGGTIWLAAGTPMQILSALLIVAPYAQYDVLIDAGRELDSSTEIQRTLDIMEQFGVSAVADRMQRFIVPAPQRYRATELRL